MTLRWRKRRLYLHRLPGSVELTAYTGTVYYAAAMCWRGRYGNGRRWWVGRATCLCAWYGPDMYDGCSDCGGGNYTPIMEPTDKMMRGFWEADGSIRWE